MSDATNYLRNALGNNTLRNTAYTPPATVYVALYTTATDVTGAGTEVVGGVGYSRQAITFGAPSPAGVFDNDAIVTFGPASGSWGTVTHFAIHDHPTAGNMMVQKILPTPKTVGTGDTASYAVGALRVTFT